MVPFTFYFLITIAIYVHTRFLHRKAAKEYRFACRHFIKEDPDAVVERAYVRWDTDSEEEIDYIRITPQVKQLAGIEAKVKVASHFDLEVANRNAYEKGEKIAILIADNGRYACLRSDKTDLHLYVIVLSALKFTALLAFVALQIFYFAYIH